MAIARVDLHSDALGMGASITVVLPQRTAGPMGSARRARDGGHPVLHLLHVAFDETRKPIEVAQATWPGPMTTLTEEYKIPAPAPSTPDTDPGLALA